MKLIRCNTFKRTVRTDYPHPDRADETVKVQFLAEFKYLSRDEIQQLPRELSQSEEHTLLDRVLVGVHGVEGEDGAAILPSIAAGLVKDDPWYTKATIAAWQNAITGAREKN